MEKGGEERGLCFRALKTAVNVVLTGPWPDFGAEFPGPGQAGDIRGRGMLPRATSTDDPYRIPEAGKPPIII